jgi:hypothetical protein
LLVKTTLAGLPKGGEKATNLKEGGFFKGEEWGSREYLHKLF